MVTNGIFFLGGLFGLLIGSFLQVVIFRYGSKKSSLVGFSACPGCDHRLNWFELIPLFSFLMLRGRCGHCRRSISWRYPLLELLAAGVVILGLAMWGLSWQTIIFILAAWISLVIVFIDIDHLMIPDTATLLFGLSGVAWQLTSEQGWAGVAQGLGAAVVGFGLIAFLITVTRGKGMGWGDAKLLAAIGLYFDWQLVVATFMTASIIGAVYGLGLLLAHRKTLKDAIPFGPFLLLGWLVVMIWSESVRVLFFLF